MRENLETSLFSKSFFSSVGWDDSCFMASFIGSHMINCFLVVSFFFCQSAASGRASVASAAPTGKTLEKRKKNKTKTKDERISKLFFVFVSLIFFLLRLSSWSVVFFPPLFCSVFGCWLVFDFLLGCFFDFIFIWFWNGPSRGIDSFDVVFPLDRTRTL